MRKIAAILTVVAIATLGAFAQSKATQRLDDAANVLRQMTSGTAGIPESVINGAKCVAVVPGLIKGAFIVGGEHGDGVATCRTTNGWSAPAFFKLTGGSWGLQIGGQKTDLVMMIMNQEGMNSLLKGHFKVGADASAAAGPVGRQASASGGWNAAILTYSRSKGAFAGINLSGAELQADNGAMSSLYGKPITVQQALTGKVEPPPQAMAFLHAVQNAKTAAASQ
jgi:lipid-binding SYLF domain-containing protein